MATPLSPLLPPKQANNLALTESQRRALIAANVDLAEELSPEFKKSPSLCYQISAFAYSTRGLCAIAGVLVSVILVLLFFPEAYLFVKYLGSPCLEIWTRSGEHYYKCRHPLSSSGQVQNPPPRLG